MTAAMGHKKLYARFRGLLYGLTRGRAIWQGAMLTHGICCAVTLICFVIMGVRIEVWLNVYCPLFLPIFLEMAYFMVAKSFDSLDTINWMNVSNAAVVLDFDNAFIWDIEIGRTNKLDEYIEWCKKNCEDRWTVTSRAIAFMSEEDATLFRLTFH